MANGIDVVVGFLVVNPEGKVLIVRSHKWSDKYSIPGGHIEAGERAEAAAEREAMEELGLKIRPVRLLLAQQTIYPADYYRRQHFVSLDYLCTSESSAIRLDAKENEEALWLSPRDALKLNLTDYARKFLNTYLSN
jgi:nucleoside triphosphatase